MIHTYSGHENKVKNNLEKAHRQRGPRWTTGSAAIVVATEDHRGDEGREAGRSPRKKTFPSYVLVELELDADTQAHGDGTSPGVTPVRGHQRVQDPVRASPRPR